MSSLFESIMVTSPSQLSSSSMYPTTDPFFERSTGRPILSVVFLYDPVSSIPS